MRIGLVGYGAGGRWFHAPYLDAADGVELVGVVTRSPERIAELRAEHDAVGELLKEIRNLTNDFAVPADACTSYQMMLKGLEEMELDLHEHIHKENNVLFPRVLELEAQLGG